MFGVIIAGRLVQTDFAQVDETHVVFSIPDADSINHVVVFMTGQTPLPAAMAGAVYFCWPSENGPSWHLLGYVANDKPSAIFKVSQLKQVEGGSQLAFGHASNQPSHMAQIGISMEPLEQVVQMTPAAHTAISKVDSFVEFSQKMLENLVNYASSFERTQEQMMHSRSETYVPLSTLQQWYTNFTRRLQQNPYFWK